MRRFLIASFIVLLAGPAWAGPAVVKPASEALVASVKTFLASPASAKALAAFPGLAAVKDLDPSALTDRLKLGPVAARLPENFALLEPETIDGETLAAALKAGSADLDAMFQAEAKEIASAVAAGHMSVEELGQRASDIDSYSRLFSLYGPLAQKEIGVITAMARASREQKTLGALQGMAGELLGPEELARVMTPGLAEGGRLAARRVTSQKELDALAESDPEAAFAAARAVLLRSGTERRGSGLVGSALDIVGRSKSEDAVAAMLHVLEKEPDHMTRRDAARYLGENASAAAQPLRERAIAELERHASRPILANVDFSLAEMAKAALAKLKPGYVYAAPEPQTAEPKMDVAAAKDFARKMLAISRVRFPELPKFPPASHFILGTLIQALGSFGMAWLAAYFTGLLLHVAVPVLPLAAGFLVYKVVRSLRAYSAQRALRARRNADADAAEQRLGFPVSAAGPIPSTPEEDAQAKAEFERLAGELRSGQGRVFFISAP